MHYNGSWSKCTVLESVVVLSLTQLEKRTMICNCMNRNTGRILDITLQGIVRGGSSIRGFSNQVQCVASSTDT
jgi:hypothetical protein